MFLANTQGLRGDIAMKEVQMLTRNHILLITFIYVLTNSLAVQKNI